MASRAKGSAARVPHSSIRKLPCSPVYITRPWADVLCSMSPQLEESRCQERLAFWKHVAESFSKETSRRELFEDVSFGIWHLLGCRAIELVKPPHGGVIYTWGCDIHRRIRCTVGRWLTPLDAFMRCQALVLYVFFARLAFNSLHLFFFLHRRAFFFASGIFQFPLLLVGTLTNSTPSPQTLFARDGRYVTSISMKNLSVITGNQPFVKLTRNYVYIRGCPQLFPRG